MTDHPAIDQLCPRRADHRPLEVIEAETATIKAEVRTGNREVLAEIEADKQKNATVRSVSSPTIKQEPGVGLRARPRSQTAVVGTVQPRMVVKAEPTRTRPRTRTTPRVSLVLGGQLQGEALRSYSFPRPEEIVLIDDDENDMITTPPQDLPADRAILPLVSEESQEELFAGAMDGMRPEQSSVLTPTTSVTVTAVTASAQSSPTTEVLDLSQVESGGNSSGRVIDISPSNTPGPTDAVIPGMAGYEDQDED